MDTKNILSVHHEGKGWTISYLKEDTGEELYIMDKITSEVQDWNTQEEADNFIKTLKEQNINI